MTEQVIADAAPDFGPGQRYPSRGRVVGPMWQAMWDAMADGWSHNGRDLIDVAVAVFGGSPKTPENLLSAAVRAGVLVRLPGRPDPVRKRRVTYYRRFTYADVVDANPQPALAPVESS